MSMHKLSTWIPITDEAIVDYGIGTAEQQAAAAERLAIQDDLREQAWRALPIWVRIHRRVRSRWWDVRYRMGRAARAFRDDDD